MKTLIKITFKILYSAMFYPKYFFHTDEAAVLFVRNM